MKVLIAEDDLRIRKMIVAMVSDLSDEIFECENGKEAQAIYAARRPDLVLMDICMPEMDGIAATRSIRSSFPEAKIVIVTTHESSAMRESAKSAGAIEYVLKENLSQLRNIISGGFFK
jgi:CheY-like chemotaxis protein